jgi:hypothetical protein
MNPINLVTVSHRANLSQGLRAGFGERQLSGGYFDELSFRF